MKTYVISVDSAKHSTRKVLKAFRSTPVFHPDYSVRVERYRFANTNAYYVLVMGTGTKSRSLARFTPKTGELIVFHTNSAGHVLYDYAFTDIRAAFRPIVGQFIDVEEPGMCSPGVLDRVASWECMSQADYTANFINVSEV